MSNRVSRTLFGIAVVLLVARLVQFGMMGFYMIDPSDAPASCSYAFNVAANVNALLFDLTGWGKTMPAPWALFLMASVLTTLWRRGDDRDRK